MLTSHRAWQQTEWLCKKFGKWLLWHIPLKTHHFEEPELPPKDLKLPDFGRKSDDLDMTSESFKYRYLSFLFGGLCKRLPFISVFSKMIKPILYFVNVIAYLSKCNRFLNANRPWLIQQLRGLLGADQGANALLFHACPSRLHLTTFRTLHPHRRWPGARGYARHG